MPDRYDEVYRAFRWNVPARFNIAESICGRWSADPARVALLWEDESGTTSRHTYRELDLAASRLCNALSGLGVARGDRVAIMLPQRPETAIAYIACFRMGAIAVPLSFLFGPEALEYRIADSGAKVAIVDADSFANLAPVLDRLPQLGAIIGAAGAAGGKLIDWNDLLAKSPARFASVDTAATDPALIIYTSGTTGPPKGALLPHSALLGNLPGFNLSHDGFPQAGDLFWSPADWAWTGGLWDALAPTLHHGMTIVGYRGRFEPERAFRLMEKYAVRNAFLFPTALKMMMKAFPKPQTQFKLALRTMMSGGEPVGAAVFEWARDELGVTINEIFGQTEINYIVGNSHALWPVKPGSMGRPYPGHRIAVIDEAGLEVAQGSVGDVAVHRRWFDGTPDPVFFLGYWGNAEATQKKYAGDWCRTGDEALVDDDGYFWYQGRGDDMFKSAGYRIGPAEIENCLVKHPAVANSAVVPSPDETRGAIIKAFVLLSPGVAGSQALAEEIRDHVRASLAPYQVPREIEFIDALPMTTTGKVQRRVLRLAEARKKGGT
jgi:acetyl-CoA synthetase